MPAYFRQHFETLQTHVELQPASHLEDFIVDGKLELSLRSYLELVMANNTDIQIQRVSLDTYRNNVTRGYGIFDPVVHWFFQHDPRENPLNQRIRRSQPAQQPGPGFDFRLYPNAGDRDAVHRGLQRHEVFL